MSRLILMSLILTQEDVQINEKGKSVGQLANRDITWKMAVKNAVCVSFFLDLYHYCSFTFLLQSHENHRSC